MRAADGGQHLIWYNVPILIGMPILAAILTPIYLHHHGFSWPLFGFFAVLFVLNNMSITCAYHRYFAHRSYEVHPILEFLYLLVASGTLQGSAVQWCTDHRRHHRMVDTDADPYSINKGFWWAHFEWMLYTDPHGDIEWPKDFTRNKWMMFQNKYYVPLAIFMGFVVPGMIGAALGFGFWPSVLIGGLLRVVLCQQSTFLINSWAHMWGKQTYSDKHSARDSLILAFFTFGEGYHNFHHSFQADYRNGMRWYHWDPSKWWIRSLSLVGLAKRLKRARTEEILKTRLAMEERHMLSGGACADRVGRMKQQIVEAQQKLRQMRESYRASRQGLTMENLRQFKTKMQSEIRVAKLEFRAAYRQWRTFRREVKRTTAAA